MGHKLCVVNCPRHHISFVPFLERRIQPRHPSPQEVPHPRGRCPGVQKCKRDAVRVCGQCIEGYKVPSKLKTMTIVDVNVFVYFSTELTFKFELETSLPALDAFFHTFPNGLRKLIKLIVRGCGTKPRFSDAHSKFVQVFWKRWSINPI